MLSRLLSFASTPFIWPFILLPALATADIEIGAAVALGDAQATLETKLSGACDAVAIHSIEPPRFPLAQSHEQHLVCEGYERAEVRFEKAIFTLADGAFVRMEAVGVDAEQLRSILGEPEGQYLNLDIFQGATLWLDHERNTLVWISEAGLHPNLFAWHSPYTAVEINLNTPDTSALPDLIDFETPLDGQLSKFETACSPLQIEAIDSIWLRNNPERQTQVNCFNFDYAGFDRKLELVFGDGELQVVWVLTAKPEESRMRALLSKEWGSPLIENATWEVFANGRISLRKDTPELLILSDTMIPLYMNSFMNPVD